MLSPEWPGPPLLPCGTALPENEARREGGRTKRGRDPCLTVLELLEPAVPEGSMSLSILIDKSVNDLLCLRNCNVAEVWASLLVCRMDFWLADALLSHFIITSY